MKDRIAIPIMDVEQYIVAYAGRAINDSQSPRYLFPKNFKKSQNLMKNTCRPYILMLDGDEAGRKATSIIENKLNLFQILFRTVNLIDGKQPGELNEDYLNIIVNQYRRE